MFKGTHNDLIEFIEAIGTGFAIYEHIAESNSFVLISCNSLYEEIIGKPTLDVLGHNLVAIFPRYIQLQLSASFQQCRIKQTALEDEILVEYKGEERYWRSIVSPILEKFLGKLRIIHTCVEITEKKLLEKQLTTSMKRYEAVVQSAYDGIITIDSKQNIKLINNSALQIFGYENNELTGEPLTKLLPHKYRKKHHSFVDGFKSSHIDCRPMETRASVRGLRKDGSEFPLEVTISKILVGQSQELTAVVRDISEKNQLLEELIAASREDSLTKLLNRRYFTELLEQEISRFKRFKHPFCLVMIDIDHFKSINDTYGHVCGDFALTSLAKEFIEAVRETDQVGRWGGEEFMVLLPETTLEGAVQFSEKLRSQIEEIVLDYYSSEIRMTISIGLCEFKEHYAEAKDIINEVDRQLYQSKREGRNRVSY